MKWLNTFIMKYILVTSINRQIISTHAKYPRHLSYFSNFGGTLVLQFWKYEKYIENQGLNKRQFVLQISPQRKLGS